MPRLGIQGFTGSLGCSHRAGISNSSGRVAQTRNFVLGPSDNSEEAWRALDEKVNTLVISLSWPVNCLEPCRGVQCKFPQVDGSPLGEHLSWAANLQGHWGGRWSLRGLHAWSC